MRVGRNGCRVRSAAHAGEHGRSSCLGRTAPAMAAELEALQPCARRGAWEEQLPGKNSTGDGCRVRSAATLRTQGGMGGAAAWEKEHEKIMDGRCPGKRTTVGWGPLLPSLFLRPRAASCPEVLDPHTNRYQEKRAAPSPFGRKQGKRRGGGEKEETLDRDQLCKNQPTHRVAGLRALTRVQNPCYPTLLLAHYPACCAFCEKKKRFMSQYSSTRVCVCGCVRVPVLQWKRCTGSEARPRGLCRCWLM